MPTLISNQLALLNQLNSNYKQEYESIWRALANNDNCVLHPLNNDYRFSDPAWLAQPFFAWIARFYLLNAQYILAVFDCIDFDCGKGKEKVREKEKIKFIIKQWLAAAAPSNCLVTNPQALLKLIDSQGASYANGLSYFMADSYRGRVSQINQHTLKVGQSLATSPGAVVYRNNLIEIIQYQSKKMHVYTRPILIIPPCINKYYIFDLRPENSFVQYALNEGYQVFILSWRNIDQTTAHKTWDDYLIEGVLSAMDVVHSISHRQPINTVGFCIGGTLLVSAIAVAAARHENKVASISLLTTLLDFKNSGLLNSLIDENWIAHFEKELIKKKKQNAFYDNCFISGNFLFNFFSALRPDELIWNFFSTKYLCGQLPKTSDFLHWNDDSANLSIPMFLWYLRYAYIGNKLVIPKALQMCDVSFDLALIRALNLPTFIYASKNDHIVPWQNAYRSCHLLMPELTKKTIKKNNGFDKNNTSQQRRRINFTLGSSGHIAGVINSPLTLASQRRCYWQWPENVQEFEARLPNTADIWLQHAKQYPGSWWPAWFDWLGKYNHNLCRSPNNLGNVLFQPIAAAPGEYVLNQSQF